ncbi:hypothetical protein SAVIM40S_00626 [Streptomyces avidinii]
MRGPDPHQDTAKHPAGDGPRRPSCGAPTPTRTPPSTPQGTGRGDPGAGPRPTPVHRRAPRRGRAEETLVRAPTHTPSRPQGTPRRGAGPYTAEQPRRGTAGARLPSGDGRDSGWVHRGADSVQRRRRAGVHRRVARAGSAFSGAVGAAAHRARDARDDGPGAAGGAGRRERGRAEACSEPTRSESRAAFQPVPVPTSRTVEPGWTSKAASMENTMAGWELLHVGMLPRSVPVWFPSSHWVVREVSE